MDVMRAQGKTAQIVEEYRAEVAKNPSSGVYHYLLGRALDDSDEKLLAFTKAVEINPDYPWGHFGLGTIYADQGNLDEAIAAWKAAVQHNPNDTLAHFNLGVTYETQGKLDEAIAAWKAALRSDPNYAWARVPLGAVPSAGGGPRRSDCHVQDRYKR